jgi:hypothetical protein
MFATTTDFCYYPTNPTEDLMNYSSDTSPKRIIILLVIALVVVIGITCSAGYVNAYNYGNRAEKSLLAQESQAKNVLANYTTKVMELVQIPQRYKKDLLEVIEKTFEGRYGRDGSKAVASFIQEKNMNLDPTMYRNVQEAIEAGRNEFEHAQADLIDQKRSYTTALGSFWQGFWLRCAGYPKIDLDKIQPVINEHTAKAFETHRDEGIKIQ